MEQFAQYLKDFEICIAECVSKKIVGHVEKITTKPNALASQPFGQLMGDQIDSEVAFTLDYYGYLKHSKGQSMMIAKALAHSPPDRFIMSTTVHFAALRIEDIVACMPEAMISYYVKFKSYILQARGFKTK